MKQQITKISKPNTNKELINILNPIVKDWFTSKFPSFAHPQKYGVMPIHSRENVLISAPTGSGKTLTGFLAILNELVDSAQKGILEDKVYAIYISPLKALGYDIKVNLQTPLKEIAKIAKEKYNIDNLGIRVGVRTGDTTQYERQKMLKNPPHILITTPESIALMLVSPKFKTRLENVDWVLIDEIHAMAENKRGVHLSLMLEQLQYHSPAMTRIGLSATVSPLKEVAKFLVGPNRNCKIVDISAIKKLDMQVISPVNDLINNEYQTIQDNMFKRIHKLIQEHKTTLIFTNTRAATENIVHTLKQKFPKFYYEAQEEPPYEYASLIGAHHGSLSKEHRFDIEQKLREGKLRCGVCSTSLELGIDIGSIDLVILLGSPKSVARALQRAGRAGHQINSITKARIIITDRDDLIECSVLLKNALENKIDSIHIPTNSYDILVQHILGFAINTPININELYELTKQSYCYKDLEYDRFYEIIKYLAGDYPTLENRNIFAKIYVNDDNTISKRGRMTRIIYATNLGTIPSSSGVTVKIGDYPVGNIDESFLERLKKGDRFVLGGDVYQFSFARGMVAQVRPAYGKAPNIPRWFSETLPLCYDLAKSIQVFRGNIYNLFKENKSKKSILEWIHDYLYVDKIAAEAIYNYTEEQYLFTKRKNKDFFPRNENIVVEKYSEDLLSTKSENIVATSKHYLIFHSLSGRKANEALSRVFAFALGRYHHRDIEIGLNDNGFYLAATKPLDVQKVIELIEANEFKQLLHTSIDNTEVIKRRFRQCAERALMILRNYKGKTKQTGRQQVSSTILLKAAQKISKDFIILKEAYREVMEDAMDIKNAQTVFNNIKSGAKKLTVAEFGLPSPFATNLILQGFADIITIGDKHKFLQNMHKLVLAKISTNKDINIKKKISISNRLRTLSELNPITQRKRELNDKQKLLIKLTKQLENTNEQTIAQIKEIIKGNEPDEITLKIIQKDKIKIRNTWPKELADFILNYDKFGKDTISTKPLTYEQIWEQQEQDDIDQKRANEFKLKKEFALAFKRLSTPYDIAENVLHSIMDKPTKRLHKKTLDYFKGEFKGTVSKYWTDNAIKYIKSKFELEKF